MKRYLKAGAVATGMLASVAGMLAWGGEEIVPGEPRIVLEQAVAIARHQVPGTVVEAELDTEGRRDIYEVKVRDPQGRMHEIKIDAATAERL